LQRVAACCSVLQRVAACCSVLQRVAACCSVYDACWQLHYSWCVYTYVHVLINIHTYHWVTSHVQICHVTHMNESGHSCEFVMSHVLIRHVTHWNASCHTYRWVMSHIWMSHVTHMNQSCHTYEWDMSQLSCCANRTYESIDLCVKSLNNDLKVKFTQRLNIWRSVAQIFQKTVKVLGIFRCRMGLIHMCDMTHSYVWHDPFISYVGHDSFIRGTRLIHMWDIRRLHTLCSWVGKHLCARVCERIHVEGMVSKPYTRWIYGVDTVCLKRTCRIYVHVEFMYV